jgi:hypothetical protein
MGATKQNEAANGRANPAPSAPVARHIERVESGFRELRPSGRRNPFLTPFPDRESSKFPFSLSRARRDCPKTFHLSYSYATPCGPALLVTQDPSETWAALGFCSAKTLVVLRARV